MSRTHNTIRYNALTRKALAHGYRDAEVRFLQVFDARDGSVPVIQRNSLDTEREESDE